MNRFKLFLISATLVLIVWVYGDRLLRRSHSIAEISLSFGASDGEAISTAQAWSGVLHALATAGMNTNNWVAISLPSKREIPDVYREDSLIIASNSPAEIVYARVTLNRELKQLYVRVYKPK